MVAFAPYRVFDCVDGRIELRRGVYVEGEEQAVGIMDVSGRQLCGLRVASGMVQGCRIRLMVDIFGNGAWRKLCTARVSPSRRRMFCYGVCLRCGRVRQVNVADLTASKSIQHPM